MRFRLFWASLLLLTVALLSAQEKKRVLRPISFKVVNVEPTTFITYEPFRISYRLEYLKPRNGKEVRVLDNLDKNHFQNALGTPVDIDFRELKKKLVPKIFGEAAFDALKLDSGPQIKVSDLQVGAEEVIGDKIRRDFVVTLKLIRETTTAAPIFAIRLEIPEVAVAWTVAELGQKEGEYQHEEPVRSGKVMVNHVLTTPTHDPNLNFRSRIFVPGYSSSSVSWFFWGIPVASLLLVGALGLALVRLYRQPVYYVEGQPSSVVEGKNREEISGVKRMKFNFARTDLWEAVVSAGNGLNSKPESRDKFLENLYQSLNNLLLSALSSAPVGSLPVDFVRILGENEGRSKLENVLFALAGLADRLKPFYEAMNSGGNIAKNDKASAEEMAKYDNLVNGIRIETLNLWWLKRIFSGSGK